MESAARERVGNVLNDKWTLERLLGVGGMAAVYSGCHRNGARAAIKVLHPDLSRHREVRERFQREGYAANKVGHPGVVKVLDDDVISSGPDEGIAYLVMELLEGESLQDRLERGPPLGEREFLAFARDVLDILQAAHDHGVVHRDLKPENLFVARDAESNNPRVKVLDFGLARLLAGQAITTYGLALGTPSFMSPEQAAGRIDEIDGRTDLFALAATGFRLRTGRRIHEGDDAVDLVRKMAQFPAPRIRSVVRDVSAPYARVIDRALEFRREDRYENAAAMGEDVRRAIAELDTGVRESGPPASEKPTVPAPRPPTTVRPRAQPAEPMTQVHRRDLARSPEYPTDESIRIPKTGSIWPWLALLLFGGVGIALWRDETHRTLLVDSVKAWCSRLWTPAGPSAVSGGPAGAPDVPPHVGIADGGALGASSDAARPTAAPSGIPSARPTAVPSGIPSSRPKPAKIAPRNLRNPPRSH
jgi:serine/threonine-protein kinase